MKSLPEKKIQNAGEEDLQKFVGKLKKKKLSNQMNERWVGIKIKLKIKNQ